MSTLEAVGVILSGLSCAVIVVAPFASVGYSCCRWSGVALGLASPDPPFPPPARRRRTTNSLFVEKSMVSVSIVSGMVLCFARVLDLSTHMIASWSRRSGGLTERRIVSLMSATVLFVGSCMYQECPVTPCT